MTVQYEITDGNKTMVVGMKAIEGGILRRGFHLTDEKQEAALRAEDPDLFPSNADEVEKEIPSTETVTTTTSNVPVKEPAKDVNEIVKAPETPKEKPDFEYALTLSESELDKYAEKFDCKLDGRKSLEKLRTEFAAFCGVEYTAPQEEADNDKTDLPKDLVCPHCGTKARTEKSYKNNHGDKCYKALKVK